MTSSALSRVKTALETLDAELIVQCYADPFLFEDVPGGERITSKQEIRTYFERLFALPQVKFSDIRIRAAEDWAVIEWTWSGARRSGEGVYAIRGVSVIELQDAKVARESIYYDPRPAQ